MGRTKERPRVLSGQRFRRRLVGNRLDAPTHNGIDVPKSMRFINHLNRGASVMKMATIGIDLAKNVLQLHAVDERG